MSACWGVRDFYDGLHVCKNILGRCNRPAAPQNDSHNFHGPNGLSNEGTKRRGAKGSIERLSGQFEPRNVCVVRAWTNALKALDSGLNSDGDGNDELPHQKLQNFANRSGDVGRSCLYRVTHQLESYIPLQ